MKIDCAACSHTALLSPAFLARLGLYPRDKVVDLQGRGTMPGLRCPGEGGTRPKRGRVRGPRPCFSAEADRPLRRFRLDDFADEEAYVAGTDMDRGAVGDAAFEDLLRQGVLQLALDHPL